MKTEDVAESHQTDFPYTFPAGHETTVVKASCTASCYGLSGTHSAVIQLQAEAQPRLLIE